MLSNGTKNKTGTKREVQLSRLNGLLSAYLEMIPRLLLFYNGYFTR